MSDDSASWGLSDNGAMNSASTKSTANDDLLVANSGDGFDAPVSRAGFDKIDEDTSVDPPIEESAIPPLDTTTDETILPDDDEEADFDMPSSKDEKAPTDKPLESEPVEPAETGNSLSDIEAKARAKQTEISDQIEKLTSQKDKVAAALSKIAKMRADEKSLASEVSSMLD